MFSGTKKPLGPLRRAFQYVSAAVLAVHFGGPVAIGFFNDRTAEQAHRLGLSETTLRGLTKAKFNIFYPEDKASYQVPMLQGLFKAHTRMREENKYAQGKYYDFYGVSFKNAVHGYRGVVDVLTLNLASKISRCSVVVPSDKLEIERLQQSFTGMNPEKIRHFPGTLKDYKALMLLHEIYHCNQNPYDTGEARERTADENSMAFFIAQGGNKEAVRSLAYGRTLNGITAFLNNGEEGKGAQDYVMGPILHHRFFDGPAMTPAESLQAHKEAAAILIDIAGPQNSYKFYDPDFLYGSVSVALSRTGLAMSPQARIVLTQAREAYEFFTRPAPAPAVAATLSLS